MKRAKAFYLFSTANLSNLEDAIVNETIDDGSMLPLKDGNDWKLLIRLADGFVENWPEGTKADVCFHVEQSGRYVLLDENRVPIRIYASNFVPKCLSRNKENDCFINVMILENGCIAGWTKPLLKESLWPWLY